MAWTLVENEDQLPLDNATSISFNISPSVQVDDLLVFGVFTRSAFVSTPAGYESLSVDNNASDQVTHLFYKRAEAGDIDTTVTFTQTDNTRIQGRYACLRTDRPWGVRPEFLWDRASNTGSIGRNWQVPGDVIGIHFASSNLAETSPGDTTWSTPWSTMIGGVVGDGYRCGLAYRTTIRGSRTFELQTSSTGSNAGIVQILLMAYEVLGADPHYDKTPLFARVESESDVAVNDGTLQGTFSAFGSADHHPAGPFPNPPDPTGSMSRSGTNTSSRFSYPHSDSMCPAGAFTIEAWTWNNTGSGDVGIFGKYLSTGDQRSWAIYWRAGNIRGNVSSLGTDFDALQADSVSLSTWHHVCLERNDEGLLRLYVDGVVRDSMTYTAPLYVNTGAPAEILTWLGSNSVGGNYVAGSRITNGVARYNGPFDPTADGELYVGNIEGGNDLYISSGATLVLWGEPSEVYFSSAGLLVLGRRRGRRIIGVTD